MANLRNCAASLSDMHDKCKRIIENRYPFEKTNDDVPLTEFGKLFAPSPVGILDSVLKSKLAPFVDSSGTSFRMDTPIGRELAKSPNLMREFQHAEQIRQVYMANGGALPNLLFTIVPPPASDAASSGVNTLPPLPGVPPTGAPSVKLNVSGTIITSPATGTPDGQTVAWPGPTPSYSALSVSGDDGTPHLLQRAGPWSMFRLFQAGSATAHGKWVQLDFAVGDKELRYKVFSSSAKNPFDLALLRDFHCPSGL